MNTFDEVIQFAITREKEAVQFYADLQNIARFTVQKQLLKEFEDMERGHVTLLQRVQELKNTERLNPDIPEDLKLNDFLVESPPVSGMTYQDILIIAIKREERSSELYTQLLNQWKDTPLEEIFTRLRTEELKHKHHFEKIYDEDIQAEN